MKFCFNKVFLFFIKLPKPEAAKSLAIPLTPKQSALLGVIEISITFLPLLLK